MVKKILIDLSEEEYERLIKIKGKRTWKQLLLEAAEGEESEKFLKEIAELVERLKARDEEHFEEYEVTRVILVRILRRDYEGALRLVDRLRQLLEERLRK